MGVLLALMVFLCPCVSALAEGTQSAASELPAGETLVDQETTVPSEAAGSSEISDPADFSETPTIPELSDPQEGIPELSDSQEGTLETLVSQGPADTEKLQEEAEDNADFEEEEPLGATKSADIAAEPNAVSEPSNQWSSPEKYFGNTPCSGAENGEHQTGTRTVEASCTTEGAVYQYCIICHIQWRIETIPKKAHEYNEEPEYQKSETCTKPWYKVYKCKNCGNTYSISVSAREHTWKSEKQDGWTPVVGGEPSCGRAGKLLRECSVCGFTETKEVAKTGEHVSVEDKSDCTRNVCKVCGKDLGLNGKEHDFDWKPIGSLNKNGQHQGTCSICGKIVCDNHIYEDDGDCTTPVECPVCGHKEEKILDALENPGTSVTPTKEAEETTPLTPAQAPSGQPAPAFVSEPEMPAVFDNTQPQTTEENSALIKGTVEVPDGKSGYKLSVEVKLPKGAASTSKLTVKDVTDTDKAIKKVVEEKFTGYLAYDLQMYNGSTSVQPDGTVEISLELPKKWIDVAVYRVVNGKMVKVKAKVKDGWIVFATEQFGIYILVNNDSTISLQEA